MFNLAAVFTRDQRVKAKMAIGSVQPGTEGTVTLFQPDTGLFLLKGVLRLLYHVRFDGQGEDDCCMEQELEPVIAAEPRVKVGWDTMPGWRPKETT